MTDSRPRRPGAGKRCAVAASFTVPLAFGLSAAGPAQATASGGWTQQAVPAATGNILALTGLDPHTVWAAGFTMTTSGRSTNFQPLVLSRTTGSHGAWTVVPTPAISGTSRATAISADGPDDVWLTGDGPTAGTVLTEHWDGTRWTVVNAPLPADENTTGELLGVVAINEHDAWAVGNGQNGGDLVGLIEHWDGTAWQPSDLPAGLAPGLALSAVAATGPHDLWAAGTNYDTGQPVLLHGDGKTWQQVDLPAVGAYGEIDALVADGEHGLWVVGAAYLTKADPGHPLVEHWDGRHWQAVQQPPGSALLLGAARTPQGLAVVGYDSTSGTLPYGEILHGSSWQSLDLPDVGSGSALNAVMSTRDGLLAVGSYTLANDYRDFFPLAMERPSS